MVWYYLPTEKVRNNPPSRARGGVIDRLRSAVLRDMPRRKAEDGDQQPNQQPTLTRIQLGVGMPIRSNRIVKFIASWLTAALINVSHTMTVIWDKDEVRIVVTIPYTVLYATQEAIKAGAKDLQVAPQLNEDMLEGDAGGAQEGDRGDRENIDAVTPQR